VSLTTVVLLLTNAVVFAKNWSKFYEVSRSEPSRECEVKRPKLVQVDRLVLYWILFGLF